MIVGACQIVYYTLTTSVYEVPTQGRDPLTQSFVILQFCHLELKPQVLIQPSAGVLDLQLLEFIIRGDVRTKHDLPMVASQGIRTRSEEKPLLVVIKMAVKNTAFQRRSYRRNTKLLKSCLQVINSIFPNVCIGDNKLIQEKSHGIKCPISDIDGKITKAIKKVDTLTFQDCVKHYFGFEERRPLQMHTNR